MTTEPHLVFNFGTSGEAIPAPPSDLAPAPAGPVPTDAVIGGRAAGPHSNAADRPVPQPLDTLRGVDAPAARPRTIPAGGGPIPDLIPSSTPPATRRRARSKSS